MSDLLNPSQRRSVTVTLRNFEISLRQALTWLDGKNENGILCRETLRLSAPKRAEMRRAIEAALAEIVATSELLSLESEEQDAAGLIRSEMSVAWANLFDDADASGENHEHH